MKCEDGALTPKLIESDFFVLADIDWYSEVDRRGLFMRNGVANELVSLELTRFRTPNVPLDDELGSPGSLTWLEEAIAASRGSEPQAT